MGAEYIRRYYGVNYQKGDRIRVNGRIGSIVAFTDQYLRVRFDGEKHTCCCHPTWRVEREATDE